MVQDDVSEHSEKFEMFGVEDGQPRLTNGRCISGKFFRYHGLWRLSTFSSCRWNDVIRSNRINDS